MTKDKFIYEIIDKCMYLSCLDNIMVENFELRDDIRFYPQIEEQFYACINFYEEMSDLCFDGKITMHDMDAELRDVIALMHQEVLKQLFADFVIYLDATKIPLEKKEQSLAKLKEELIEKKIDTGFLLNKIQEFRNLEQESCVSYR